jgi:dolichol-phosphate mannosyltransferase
MELSIVIPAYLEEENLRILLPRIKKTAVDIGVAFEILIVDTITAMDNTKLVCEEVKVRYLNREKGNRYGDAVRTGIAYASGKHIIFMDADGSHSPEFINNLFHHKDEHDVVIASRFINGGGSDNNKILKLMSWMVNFSYSFLFNLQCKDVSNSFKLYNGDQLRSIHLKCEDFDVVEEILIKLKRQNKKLSIKELPFLFKERMFGHTKRNLLAFVFSYIFTLIRLKFNK